MAPKILIVDDDENLRLSLRTQLARAGYEVATASDGQEALRLIYQEHPSLVILDVMIPQIDGWEVCRQVRTMSDIAILMLTIKAESKDVVKGFELGADDYLDKPFDSRELLARVRSVLRRTRTSSDQGTETYQDAYLTVDLHRRRIEAGGVSINLSPTEFDILALLVRNRGHVQSYDRILLEVWGLPPGENIDYVRTYIWHLRSKIEPEPENPRYLINDFGLGYHFEPDP